MNISPVYNNFINKTYKTPSDMQKRVNLNSDIAPKNKNFDTKDILASGIAITALAAFSLVGICTLKKGVINNIKLYRDAKAMQNGACEAVKKGKRAYDEVLSLFELGNENGFLNIVDDAKNTVTAFRKIQSSDGTHSFLLSQIDTKCGLAKKTAIIRDKKPAFISIYDSFGANRTDFTYADGKISAIDEMVIDFGNLGKTINKSYVFNEDGLSLAYSKAKKVSDKIVSADEFYFFKKKKPSLIQFKIKSDGTNFSANETFLANKFGFFKKITDTKEEDEVILNIHDNPLSEAIEDAIHFAFD